MGYSSVRLFLIFLIPRLVVGGLFSAIGYIGSGGDPETYHVLGLYARDLWFEPENASLDGLLDEWWTTDEESITDKYSLAIGDVESGRAGLAMNGTAPIIGVHAAVYSIWRHPFAFVFTISVLSSLSYLVFIRRLGVATSDVLLYALNPVSIFFAATHYKESICESLVITLLASLAAKPKHGYAAMLSVAFAMFRSAYIPLIPLIWLSRLVSRFDSRLVIGSAFVLFALAPSFYWILPGESAGPIYSIVQANEYTQRVLGPLVGLLMPLPFVESVATPFGALLTVYAFFYWCFLPVVLIHVAMFRRPEGMATTVVLVALGISYYVVGGIAAKARFFAPFVPMLILAFTQVREPVFNWLASRLRSVTEEQKFRVKQI